MIEVIPAILTDREEEFVRLVRKFEAAGIKRVHLDICDGIFVPTKTISGYQELKHLKTDLDFDVHLMVKDPHAACDSWRETCARRVIVHVEAADDFDLLAEHAHACHKELGAAINPETPLERLEPAAAKADFVQFMTVHPGAQGRSFVPEVVDRVRLFAANHPGMTIMADGGITPQTAPQCVAAGATVLVSGSYLANSVNIKEAMEELRRA